MTEKKTETKQSIYERLSKIDISKAVQKKMGLNYLSWANAWGYVKAIYPDAKKEITEYPEYLPTNDGWKPTGRMVDYRLTPAGCEVEATVIIDGQKFSSQLYAMDNRNRVVKNPDYAQINKAQMRALVKALATAGLGLNVYAGDDLPANEEETAKKVTPIRQSKRKSTAKPNFKTMTEAQLKNYTVKYQEEKDKDPIELKVSAIYTLALQGNQSARNWFEKMKTKLNTEEGQAVAQFRSSRYAAQIRQSMKSKEEVKEA